MSSTQHSPSPALPFFLLFHSLALNHMVSSFPFSFAHTYSSLTCPPPPISSHSLTVRPTFPLSPPPPSALDLSSPFFPLHHPRLTLPLTLLCFAAPDSTKEAFSLFDKKGRGSIGQDQLGDLLRALGQNPTQAEVNQLKAGLGGGEGESRFVGVGLEGWRARKGRGWEVGGEERERGRARRRKGGRASEQLELNRCANGADIVGRLLEVWMASRWQL